MFHVGFAIYLWTKQPYKVEIIVHTLFNQGLLCD